MPVKENLNNINFTWILVLGVSIIVVKLILSNLPRQTANDKFLLYTKRLVELETIELKTIEPKTIEPKTIEPKTIEPKETKLKQQESSQKHNQTQPQIYRRSKIFYWTRPWGGYPNTPDSWCYPCDTCEIIYGRGPYNLSTNSILADNLKSADVVIFHLAFGETRSIFANMEEFKLYREVFSGAFLVYF